MGAASEAHEYCLYLYSLRNYGVPCLHKLQYVLNVECTLATHYYLVVHQSVLSGFGNPTDLVSQNYYAHELNAA